MTLGMCHSENSVRLSPGPSWAVREAGRVLWVCTILAGCGLASCTPHEPTPSTRFEPIPPTLTNVTFSNDLPYTEDLNPYTYRAFFNGGGVAVADLDGDGLQDLIFTGNLVDNRVYRNLGDWRFEDVTRAYDLGAEGAWATGVSVADVDGDGLRDVLICKSGPPMAPNRRNELRLQRPDGRFVDVAAEVGLADLGFGVQGAFVDYDRDGDLDVYLLNNSVRSVGGYDLRPGQRERRDELGANKLYRNLLVEEGALRFEDVSEAAGIYGSDIGFGLGVAVGDINGDRWPDLYVSNDFFERDYLYVNRGDGRFAERLTDLVPETAMGAMGADLADLDRDGAPEIFVSEMLPRGARRARTKAVFQPYRQARRAEDAGYHRQYGRNVLLANDGAGRFSELGRQAGVDATDWSWGALMCDLDNDGWRDLYVANGTLRDPLDQDYLRFLADKDAVRALIQGGEDAVMALIDSMPTEPQPNFAFRQTGPLTFADSTAAWGLDAPSFSNGSAYGDLDNDGDLDLVVNVADGPPLLYRNRSRERSPDATHYLRLRLHDPLATGNREAWGSRVTVYTPAGPQVGEVGAIRGFLSATESVLHFGLGADARVDSVRVDWSLGGTQVLRAVPADTLLTIARAVPRTPLTAATDIETEAAAWTPLGFTHVESAHDDFDRYPLKPEMHSAEGPALAIDEAHEWLYVGGGRGQAGAVFRWGGGAWRRQDWSPPTEFLRADHVAAVWTDLDGDGRSDLVVGTGGDESSPEQLALRPFAFRQTRTGQFHEIEDAFPRETRGLSCGALLAEDFDGDGDRDLFFGTHFRLRDYAAAAPSLALLNDGTGRFTAARVPALDTLNLVRAAVATDLDGDGTPELAVAREYRPLVLLELGGAFAKLAEGPSGLWRALAFAPATSDAPAELLAGNLGLNSRLRTRPGAPLQLRVGNLDGGGGAAYVPVLPIDGEWAVGAQLQHLTARMPALRKRFPHHADYGAASVDEVLPGRPAVTLEATELRSGGFRWDGRSDGLSFSPWPAVAQRSSVRAIAYHPPSGRAYLGGNYGYVLPEFGGQHGATGVGLERGPDGAWINVPGAFPFLRGEVRGLALAHGQLIAARNDTTAVRAPLTTPR